MNVFMYLFYFQDYNILYILQNNIQYITINIESKKIINKDFILKNVSNPALGLIQNQDLCMESRWVNKNLIIILIKQQCWKRNLLLLIFVFIPSYMHAIVNVLILNFKQSSVFRSLIVSFCFDMKIVQLYLYWVQLMFGYHHNNPNEHAYFLLLLRYTFCLCHTTYLINSGPHYSINTKGIWQA